jgi:dsDNA-specific endonuclease/ATPase MutS2
MSTTENAKTTLRGLVDEVTKLKRIANETKAALAQQMHLTKQQNQQIEILQQQNQQILQILKNINNNNNSQRDNVSVESHTRDIPQPTDPKKIKKDGGFYCRNPTKKDYETALRLLVGKDDVETEWELLGMMANSLRAEIITKYPAALKKGWIKIPEALKNWATAEFEDRLGGHPYNIPVNRAQSSWMATLVSQRWGNKGRENKGKGNIYVYKKRSSYFFFFLCRSWSIRKQQ